jgi:hypothetical protein
MTPLEESARRLARLMLAGPLTPSSVLARVQEVLGRKPRWLESLAKKASERLGEGTRPRQERLERVLRSHAPFARAVALGLAKIPVEPPRPVLCPAGGAPGTWAVPPLETVGELARWLRVGAGELEWFADLRDWNATERLGHYRHRFEAKPSGGARLVEAPKLRLKFLQRQVLRGVLDAIPPHESAHGFRAGRSIHTFVAPHAGRDLVLRLDLRDFFPSIGRARVTAIFLTAGYPQPVAMRLAGLCTTATPARILDAWPSSGDTGRDWSRAQVHAMPHLPQGAPTSPALANLAAHRLDCRLAGLARSVDAAYTRYADDLVFSGDAAFARMAGRFHIQAAAIALEEGFEVHARKTRILRQGVQQKAAGIVLNAHPNLPRRELDSLKALLHNCVEHGPESQNRAAHPDFRRHLEGRIAHALAVNPSRGSRLRELLDRIQWPE